MRRENEYGLTLEEWVSAANFGRAADDEVPEGKARKAWRDGEDPTEYAAAPVGTFRKGSKS